MSMDNDTENNLPLKPKLKKLHPIDLAEIGSEEENLSNTNLEPDFETTKSNLEDSEPEITNLEDLQKDEEMPESDLENDLKNSPKSGFFHKLKTFFVKYKSQILLAALFFFILGVGGVTVSAVWVLNKYNNLGDIVSQATAITEGSIIVDRNDKEIFRFNKDGQKRELIASQQIPDQMKGSIIALEDENFYTNQIGIPWQNLVGAGSKCFLSGGSNCRGGSGLSQQLIKNVTGENAPTTGRKLNELLAAIKFNQEIGTTEKEKQDSVLELYLNWVPFGRNTYGVAAASKSYFNKDITTEELTIPQTCYLASMVQRPSTYATAIENEIKNRRNPENKIVNLNWDLLETRKNSCVQKMFELKLKNRGTEKFIQSQLDSDKLQDEIVDFIPKPIENLVYGHLINYITDELTNTLKISEGELSTKGYKIKTTFDLDLQNNVQNIITSTAEDRVVKNGGNNAAGVVLDGPTGEILAMIGSRDFNNESIAGQVNVTTAPRQPGSSFKPYVYASALNNGFNPGTVLLDLTTDFGNYRPANFSRTTTGITTIRSSLQNSFNIPAVKSTFLSAPSSPSPNTNGGLNNVLNFTENVGVKMPFRDSCTLSASLGGCELTLLSHAGGINTLLHNGNYRAPKLFKKITFKDRITGLETNAFNNIISTEYQDRDGVVKPEIANQVANIMSDYGARSTSVWGAGKKTLELDGWSGDNSVAAKTGTTNDVKDTWTVGGSPLYTVAIWAGNTDGKPMNSKATSTTTAAATWKDIMTLIHKDKVKQGFSKDGLKQFALDPSTGLPGSGKPEWLTNDQIKILQDAEKKLNDPNYNPLENSIFNNRTPVIQRKLLVSKIDGLLIPNPADGAVSGYPAELTTEISCKQIISEFPKAANWLAPVGAYQQRIGADFTPCPTEITSLDITKQGPDITTNIDITKPLINPLTISAKSKITDGTIVELSFSIGGVEVDKVQNLDKLEIDILAEDITGIKDIIIKATDNFGLSSELVIENVDFGNIASSSSKKPKSSSSSSSRSSSSSSSSSISSSSSSSSS